MNENIKRLHALASYYESTGCWYFAEIIRGMILEMKNEA